MVWCVGYGRETQERRDRSPRRSRIYKLFIKNYIRSIVSEPFKIEIFSISLDFQSNIEKSTTRSWREVRAGRRMAPTQQSPHIHASSSMGNASSVRSLRIHAKESIIAICSFRGYWFKHPARTSSVVSESNLRGHRDLSKQTCT